MPPGWLQPRAGGVTIDVKVIPKSSREAIGPERDGRLIVKVSAPPEDGKANAAVCKLIAKQLKLAKSHVLVETGETSRTKRLFAEGIELDRAEALLNNS